MKQVNIGAYLVPNGTELGGHDRDKEPSDPPKHDPTYSVLLGYGFRHRPKPRQEQTRTKAD